MNSKQSGAGKAVFFEPLVLVFEDGFIGIDWTDSIVGMWGDEDLDFNAHCEEAVKASELMDRVLGQADRTLTDAQRLRKLADYMEQAEK